MSKKNYASNEEVMAEIEKYFGRFRDSDSRPDFNFGKRLVLPNHDIHTAILESGLRSSQVARFMGISFSTFCNWMREEMPPERKERVLKAVRELAGGE